MKERNNKYSPEFKIQCVKEVLEEHISQWEVTRKYELKTDTNIRKWIKNYLSTENSIFTRNTEAIVKLIFEWRRQKISLRGIAERLQDMEVKAPHGGDVWYIETIRKILNNEKYRGDVLLQKTYVSVYFSGKQLPNKGEPPKYLIENHHEGIIIK